MAEILPFEPPGAPSARRWTIGVLVSSDCARLSAALVAASGQGLATRPEVGEGITAEVPHETTAWFTRLADAAGTVPPAEMAESLSALRAQLADHVGAIVDALLSQAGVPPSRILAIGVQDPGLWMGCGHWHAGYLALCDPARLAELTGMNIIDAFPARDLACGGQGGPLTAVAEWVFLRHAHRNRLVLDLGRTTRLTWLPRATRGQGLPHLLAFDVGPGTRLLDLLTERLTGGEQAFDPGGRLAVQGHRIDRLIEHWLADPYFRRSPPRWHPRGVRPERFLVDALRMAVEAGWSVRDLLCTATHFIAEAVALAIQRRLPEDARIDEIVLTGGGQHNGMLLREIAAKMPGVPVTRTSELGIATEALGPACVGLLAMFHLDQVPGNPPEVTGTEVSRVLGRLTPGSPQSWQRLLAEMTGSKPAVRPLRSAL